jgi:DNA-binding TFAR19-related protein (PDSD5 family)
MAQVFRNFLAGRQQAQDEDAYQNSLAQQELGNTRDARLMEMRETDFANAQTDRTQQQEQASAEAQRQAVLRASGIAKHGLTLPPEHRKQFLQRTIPVYSKDFALLGEDTSDMSELLAQSDEELEADLRQLAAISNPEQPQERWTDVQGPRGTLLQQNSLTGEKRQVVAQAPSAPASLQRQFRTLSPEEVQAQGFPAGTVVQQDANTGELNVVTKRDNTGSLSQKDMTTARMKLNTVQLARQQLEAIRQRFGDLKGSVSAGAFGQGRLPTERGKAFDAAVDQMRSTLTALTRVPGVGAMSDYETRLDQAKFPSRQNYESVTAQQIDAIDGMLNAIESGYTDLLGGQSQQAQPGQPAPAVDVEALLNKYAPRQ